MSRRVNTPLDYHNYACNAANLEGHNRQKVKNCHFLIDFFTDPDPAVNLRYGTRVLYCPYYPVRIQPSGRYGSKFSTDSKTHGKWYLVTLYDRFSARNTFSMCTV
eukprot:SAG11_NODE_601_length_8254_cov_12.333047_1_plen_105_part_00